MKKKVAMIGVGKLGEPCAEAMSQYHDVVGYDVLPRAPIFPMKKTIAEAVEGRDLIFIAAPTPHDPKYDGRAPTAHLDNKDFDYTIVKEILKEVNESVNKEQLVILISTVLPGTVRRELEPLITNARFAVGSTKFQQSKLNKITSCITMIQPRRCPTLLVNQGIRILSINGDHK